MASEHSPAFLRVVQDAKTRIREITPEDVQAAADAGRPFVLIDVREDREWAVDSCAGAVHLGKGVLERDVEQAFPDLGRTLVLYCGGGFRSALAADSLRAMGYGDPRSMAGGIRRWRELGLPLDSRSGS
jgi:rhodanese-related sulfurtransferase